MYCKGQVITELLVSSQYIILEFYEEMHLLDKLSKMFTFGKQFHSDLVVISGCHNIAVLP